MQVVCPCCILAAVRPPVPAGGLSRHYYCRRASFSHYNARSCEDEERKKEGEWGRTDEQLGYELVSNG